MFMGNFFPFFWKLYNKSKVWGIIWLVKVNFLVLITCLVLLIKITTTMHIRHLIFWAVRRRWYCLTMVYESKYQRKGKNRWSADFNLNFGQLRALLLKIITFYNVWLLNFYISRCKHVDNFFWHWNSKSFETFAFRWYKNLQVKVWQVINIKCLN